MYLKFNRKVFLWILCLFPFFVSANSPTSPHTWLLLPIIEEGLPTPGKLVRVYLDEYPEAYYVVFLPYNFKDAEREWPMVFESPGNTYKEISSGFPDEIFLGYGLTRGMDYICVGVPFIDEDGRILRSYCREPMATVNFWLAVLEDLNEKFHIDNDRILLSGFSRGSVSTSYIGNYNDSISTKWAAYFAHSHFDGCCQTVLGSPKERINRIKTKKVLISVGENDIAKKCSKEAYERLIDDGISATYIEIPNLDHSPAWLLEESESAEKARRWLRDTL
jgi:hypothetical protein